MGSSLLTKGAFCKKSGLRSAQNRLRTDLAAGDTTVGPRPKLACGARVANVIASIVGALSPVRAAIKAPVRSMLSTSMDSLAVSLQPGSTNYESNSTPVPGIGNQSLNCATGTSLDFNDRESHKLRLSDTGVGFRAGSLDWLRAGSVDRRMQTPENG